MSYARLRPAVSVGEYDAIDAVVFAVDAQSKAMDRKWGMGRLSTLVSIEWAERFAVQGRKFGEAIASNVYADVKKHGEAMERAFVRLDQLATDAGAEQGPPEQWEFAIPDGVVILVQDIRRANQVERDGRPNAQVWSLDEIANVIRQHPLLAAAKEAFPEAVMIEPVGGKPPTLVDDEVPF